MLAPVLSYMSAKDRGRGATSDPDGSVALVGTFGSDERTRRTCTVAMVPPCLASAARHISLGHVEGIPILALPLAAGAIFGSAVAGQQLDGVPCEEEFRYGLSLLLFAHGCWSYFLPWFRGTK